MRICKGRFYVTAEHPGISGFQRWDELEYRIVTAERAKAYRTRVVGEYLPIAEDFHRCEDGHLVGHQPIMRTPDALAWLSANPYRAVIRLDPATRSKDVVPHYQER